VNRSRKIEVQALELNLGMLGIKFRTVYRRANEPNFRVRELSGSFCVYEFRVRRYARINNRFECVFELCRCGAGDFEVCFCEADACGVFIVDDLVRGFVLGEALAGEREDYMGLLARE